jgi:hypothetical protein
MERDGHAITRADVERADLVGAEAVGLLDGIISVGALDRLPETKSLCERTVQRYYSILRNCEPGIAT